MRNLHGFPPHDSSAEKGTASLPSSNSFTQVGPMNISSVLTAAAIKPVQQGVASMPLARIKKPGKTFLGALFLAFSTMSMGAQPFPEKPIRIVTAHPPGGIADVVTRAVAHTVERRIGKAIIVEAKPGGKQIIAVSTVARAAPDGYTLLLGSASSMALNPIVVPNLPYDVARDLTPVTRLFSTPLLLITSTPAKTPAELVSYIKANPGKVNYASFGPGSSLQLAAELFAKTAGVSITEVPYAGSAPSLNALLSGSVHLMFDAGISSIPHVKSGKLNLLAQTGPTRAAYLPDTPTMAEVGFPDVQITGWWGLLAPAGTPTEIVELLAREFAIAVKDEALVAKLQLHGIQLDSSSPKEFGNFIKNETRRLGDFVRSSNLKLE